MKAWLRKHDTLAKVIVIVLSPIILPVAALYWAGTTILEVADSFMEALEDWWNLP